MLDVLEDAGDAAGDTDGLKRFASFRSLGLGLSHVRDVVGGIEWPKQEN